MVSNYFVMASNRRLAIYIILIAGTLTVAGLAVLSWMDPLVIDNLARYRVDLYITNIQFDDDYLNVTVRNIGWNPTTISSVIINETSTLHTVPVQEPISPGEIISFRTAFKWTSDYSYQIKLETTDNFEKHGCNIFSAIAP
jgi:hypothetical protein